MQRPDFSLTNRFIFLLTLGTLAGCAVAPQTASNAPTPSTYLTPQPLIGATPATLNAEFGQPALLRVDGTAQVWLYHSDSCGLNLILYPDASGIPRVTNVSASDDAGAQDCTASLQQAHLDSPMTPAAAQASLPVPALGALEHPASS